MYQRIRIKSEMAMNTPSEVLFHSNGVSVHKSLIPYSHETAKVVYFVSGSNGDEFGQFPTSDKAIEKGIEMSKLTEQERAQFDE